MNLFNRIKSSNDMNTQVKADKLSITLSLACMIHCLLMPSFLILTSGFLALSIDNELIHKVFLIIVLPISLYALITGYQNHKILSYLYLGISGLWLLFFAVFFGEGVFGEFTEKSLTLIGSMIVASSHYKNYKACKELACECHE
ncbi:MerC domain-containing protein [Pseudomonadota bacterium]|nr:MerC domain-containing protein [Pseudomonadota bacterium]MDC0198864.1 MerC domain-containing protein [Pseudomonadota bacterium]